MEWNYCVDVVKKQLLVTQLPNLLNQDSTVYYYIVYQNLRIMIISYDHVETKLMDRDILSKSINFHKVLSNATGQSNFDNVS